eukprot:733603-Prymnesium_polylepis.1
MSDAKAVVSLVANICGPDHSSDTPGLYQAALNVVQLDSADVAMNNVAKTARSFRQLLAEPQFEVLRSVVGPLGDERAKDLLQFVGGIDDLRVLVDSAVDAVVSASTVSSVQGLGPILKPFLSIPPSWLHGNEDAFCERFAALLEANQTSGVNVAAQLIDCCNNIHGLERLQRNISDKSAQTKEIISAIVEHGQWHFKLVWGALRKSATPESSFACGSALLRGACNLWSPGKFAGVEDVQQRRRRLQLPRAARLGHGR